jgi:NAD(P)-dependent dehydrogenase (short-subunit alcohol dehydrogenase family)
MSPSTRPVVLVTGAAGLGVGTTTCIRFAQEGYHVVATDIQDGLSEESESIKSIKKHLKENAECLVLRMDVCSADSVNEGVLALLLRYPPRHHPILTISLLWPFVFYRS